MNCEIAKARTYLKLPTMLIGRAQNHISVLMKIIFWLAENVFH